MSSYPTLIHRKAIAARLLVWESILPFEAALGSAFRAVSTELEQLLEAKTSAASWDKESPDTQRLDHFVRGIVERFLERAKDHLAGRFPTQFDALQGEVMRRVNALSCESCCRLAELEPSAVCRGGETTDDETVERGGLCLDQIRQIFSRALSLAVRCYFQYGGVQPDSLPSVALSVNVLWDQPEILFRRYFVNGSTIRTDQGVQIQLYINYKKFDVTSYLAIYYVFAHELIAHAFAALSNSPNDWRTIPKHAEFDEGWMDYVAAMVVSSSEPDLSKETASQLQQKIDEGRRFHETRHDFRHREANEDVRTRAFGRDVAVRFHRVVSKLVDNHTDQFICLSLKINMLQLDGAKKSVFVNQLDVLLAAVEDIENSSQLTFHKKVQELIITQDVTEFMNSVDSEVQLLS